MNKSETAMASFIDKCCQIGAVLETVRCNLDQLLGEIPAAGEPNECEPPSRLDVLELHLKNLYNLSCRVQDSTDEMVRRVG